ncbi:MAG: FAD-dependent monooxygenase [Pseudomonadota bacterium]
MDTPVIVAGEDPVGLTLSFELDYQGVDCILSERNAATSRRPKDAKTIIDTVRGAL